MGWLMLAALVYVCGARFYRIRQERIRKQHGRAPSTGMFI